ncbi:hypothetical protein V8E51_007460 [Hyaloscypha variabilis]
MGRSGQSLPSLASFTSHPERDEAPANAAMLIEYVIGGGTAARVVGSPKTVVDELERWVEIAHLDGFNLAQLVNPGSFEDIIEFVLPEVQRRGLFRTRVEKEGATARETYIGVENGWLLPDHPGRQFRWVAGEEPPVYAEPGRK